MNRPAPRRGWWFVQLRGELEKLLARKRTYIGFGAFVAMEILILAILTLPRARQAFGELMANNGLRFEDGYTGLTLAFLIIRFTVILLCELYLALVAGDLVAKEVEEGTIRLVLARPVSRMRVFGLKVMAGVIHTFVLMTFIGATGLLAGVLYRRGLGNLVVFAPKHEIFAMFSPAAGLGRYLRGILFLGLAYQMVSALGLMFSCFKIRPAAAATVTLSVVFVDFALRNIPAFYPYENCFLTHHLACWVWTYQEFVPWPAVAESLCLLAGLTVSCWIVGAACFCNRDFK